MASLGPEIFSHGFRLNPSPLDAGGGAPLHDAVRPAINHADVYASEPGDRFRPLPKAGHRFFFSFARRKLQQQPQRGAGKASRAARAAGSGSQGVAGVVDGGEVRKLRYKKGDAYTDWLMDECSTPRFRRLLTAGGDQEASAAAADRSAGGGLLRGVLRATTAVRACFTSASAASSDPPCSAESLACASTTAA